jgi:hypothetical protein
VATKASLLSSSKKTLSTQAGISSSSLQQLVLKEVEIGVQMCNGENNKKLGLDKAWTLNYVSISRTLVRNWWFISFMSSFFDKFVNEP